MYRFIRDIDMEAQLFGLFGHWLAFIGDRDAQAFKLALEAPGDRIVDPPPPKSRLPSWLASSTPGSAASGVADGASPMQAMSQPH